jgi:hypothetical protein
VLQAYLPTGDGGGDSAADTKKKSRRPSKAKPEWIEQQGGELNWGGERRRWRRTEARPTDHDMEWPDLLVTDAMVMMAADDCRG